MENIESILNQRNIRPTAMRLLIYQFLEKQHVAISLGDLEASFDKAERTTLYRNLKTFEKKGMVHKIDDGSGIAKYALCEMNCTCDIDTDLHIHFHCRLCDETICLTEHKFPEITLPQNFMAENANLVVKGICGKCK